MRVVQRWAPWIGVAVLVAGIGAYAATRNSGASPAPRASHRVAPLAQSERAVALEFVHTAVARKRLGRAWDISAPELRQDMSLAQWRTGTIPVVPYPVAEAVVRLKVVSSFADTARLEVDFLPRSGTTTRPAKFALDMRSVGGSWLVTAWQPTSTVVPPKGK